MMTQRGKNLLIFTAVVAVLLLAPATAYANSSWHWLTHSPAKLLLPAIIATLLIEIIAIGGLAGARSWRRVALVVTLANLFSFLAPYLLRVASMVANGIYAAHPFEAAWDRGPFYIVMAGYLVLTLIIEIPTVYFSLRRHCPTPRRLLIVTISANIITTALVAAIERFLCTGHW